MAKIESSEVFRKSSTTIPLLQFNEALRANVVFGIIPVAKTTKFDSTQTPSVNSTFSTIPSPEISFIVVFSLNYIP